MESKIEIPAHGKCPLCGVTYAYSYYGMGCPFLRYVSADGFVESSETGESLRIVLTGYSCKSTAELDVSIPYDNPNDKEVE